MSELTITDYEKEIILRAFKEELKKAVYYLAINKNGKQLVGVQEKPLKEVYEAIDKNEWWALTENEMIEIKYDLKD